MYYILKSLNLMEFFAKLNEKNNLMKNQLVLLKQLGLHRFWYRNCVVQPNKEKQIKERMVTFLKQQDFLSCTTNLWSYASVAQDSILNLTGEYTVFA